MAKKISEDAALAFVQKGNFHRDNTLVSVINYDRYPVIEMTLHGNRIASWCPSLGSFYTTLAGWNTPTTRDRLHALIWTMHSYNHIPQHNIYRMRQGELYWGNILLPSAYGLQWHAFPPVNAAHPGCLAYDPKRDGVIPMPAPTYEELLDLTFGPGGGVA